MSTWSLTYRRNEFKWNKSNNYFWQFYPLDGGKTSWHRYGTKLRQCHRMSHSPEIGVVHVWKASSRIILFVVWSFCLSEKSYSSTAGIKWKRWGRNWVFGFYHRRTCGYLTPAFSVGPLGWLYLILVYQSCSWVGLTYGLGWVEIFQFLLGWVGSTVAKVLKI